MDEEEESLMTKRWLSWCESHGSVKCTEYDVPEGILPRKYAGTLVDVKVGGKRRCPDDIIYSKHEELRKKVARGNCVLHLKIKKSSGKGDSSSQHVEKDRYVFATFALRKFSGGLGDEDETNPAVQNQWNLYFLQSPELAEKVVATVKANGEAAHISCRILDGQRYFIIGSKNVHLLVRNSDDIAKYPDSRFEFARIIARTFFTHAEEKIGPENLQRFAEYLDETHCTAVLEILQPDNEHVVSLSYLDRPQLLFICWAQPYSEHDSPSLCWLPPNEAIDKARSVGLDTVDYTVIPASEAEREMSEIRADEGYEGKVLYFVDGSGNVFGMVKKKTCWYIILRAIREKTSAFLSTKSAQSVSQMRAKVAKRITEIQHWLGFSDRYRQAWMELAMGFIQWALSKSRPSGISCRSHFPLLWNMFIKSSEKHANLYHNLKFETQ